MVCGLAAARQVFEKRLRAMGVEPDGQVGAHLGNLTRNAAGDIVDSRSVDMA